MEHVKNELQHIILGNEPFGSTSKLKKAQAFLRRNAETGFYAQEQQLIKSQEAAQLIIFGETENLLYQPEIDEANFISAGAEQRVYRLDDYYILKTNDSIFYKYWLDYFDSLLLHNYFFPATSYEFLGFKNINDVLHAVVKQEFVHTTEATDLTAVKQFMAYNGFQNTRNNDYFHPQLGIIFEDLHDENVLCNNGILFFVDTVFYLTEKFYA
jgi:hypothetical protein